MENASGTRDEQPACGEPGCAEESHLLRTIGWVFGPASGAVALGLIVGREIRQRYKLNHRTPYDLYAHSGDQLARRRLQRRHISRARTDWRLRGRVSKRRTALIRASTDRHWAGAGRCGPARG